MELAKVIFTVGFFIHLLWLTMVMLISFKYRRCCVFLGLQMESLFLLFLTYTVFTTNDPAFSGSWLLIISLFSYIRGFTLFAQIIGNPLLPIERWQHFYKKKRINNRSLLNRRLFFV